MRTQVSITQPKMGIETQFALNLAAKGTRMDKRKQDQFRDIKIETGIIQNAEGSARVKIGQTEIIAGVKMSVGEPFPDKLDEGILIVSAEFSPIASPMFELGPPKEDAIELARVIDRGIRESGTIQMEKLCIKKEELVWLVFIDISIINHSGNLIDAAALAAAAAISSAKIPEYNGKKVDYTKRTKKLPVKYKPIAITLSKISGKLFIDTNLDEEGVTDAKLTITTKDDGNICSIQKSGLTGLSLDEIKEAVQLAVKKGKELRKLI